VVTERIGLRDVTFHLGSTSWQKQITARSFSGTIIAYPSLPYCVTLKLLSGSCASYLNSRLSSDEDWEKTRNPLFWIDSQELAFSAIQRHRKDDRSNSFFFA
jgi:hypothetical protein